MGSRLIQEDGAARGPDAEHRAAAGRIDTSLNAVSSLTLPRTRNRIPVAARADDASRSGAVATVCHAPHSPAALTSASAAIQLRIVFAYVFWGRARP